ncbi:MAG: PadR family transcriptional regulator [Longimicrobiales bacterium]|nr:PadR family transcriptional regulator [Longimicrobiales bacterium]
MAPDTPGDPRTRLPLKHVDFQILLVLADRDLHGYGLVKEIEVRTEGRFSLEPGNLYRYVGRLVDQDLVARAERRPAADAQDERRRYYRITEFGRQVLSAEAARLKALVEAVERRTPLPEG